jgi:tetratricopeptide (TPR) repeat protein
MSNKWYFIFSLLVVAVCFANSLPNDFILDDYGIVAVNPAIRTISPIHLLVTPYWGEKSGAGIYRPLTLFSFALEYPLWHRWAPGYRLVNLLLHAINGLLVFVLARELLQSFPAAWAASALYLVHPVHTEAVVGITGRGELLAAMFFLLAWLLFRKKRIVLCSIAFFFSLLSKENAIAFPLVIAIDTWISEGSFKRLLSHWKRFVPIAVSGAVYLSLRLWALGTMLVPADAQYFNGRWTLSERELTSGRAFLNYFRLLLAPVTVTGDYDFNSIPIAHAWDWDAWIGLLLVVLTIVFALRMARRQPGVALGILFFYSALLPVSNWIVPTSLIMAERHLYLPSLGICLLGAAIWVTIPNLQVKKILAVGVMTVACILCIAHNYIWRDNLSFYGNIVRVFPDNIRGRQGYGVAFLESGRPVEASAQFEAGLRIMRTPPLLVGLAAARMTLDGGCTQARPLLDEALRIRPADHFGRWLSADCFQSEGDLTKAEETFRRAITDAQFPDPRLLFDWGLSLERLGRMDEALEAYRRAARLDPDDLSLKQSVARLAPTGSVR